MRWAGWLRRDAATESNESQGCHGDLTSHKPNSLDLPSLGRSQCNDFDQRLAGLGDHERLTFRGLIYQSGQAEAVGL